VLLGNVLVNNKKITYCNAAIRYFDIVRFTDRVADLLRAKIVERFKINSTFFSIPRYMHISYKYMLGFVYKEPKRTDLVFPIKAIDVYRSADYC